MRWACVCLCDIVPDRSEGDVGGEEEEEADEGEEGDDQGCQVKPWKYDHEDN